jgi:DNA adenine methylase
MQKQTKINSPLRYPGSKYFLVKFITKALEINELRPSLFIEPFVGGGSIAINLLVNNLVDRVILLDRDPWITSFWKVVFFDTNWLIEQIRSVEVTIENWHQYKDSKPKSLREQAITCLFLNRTNFSGILEERVGPLGGKEQTSKYKIDCRFNTTTKETIIARIQTISSFRDRIYKIWNCSWDVGVLRIREAQSLGKIPLTNLFFYFDPPFFKNADTLYRYYFLNKDHQDLHDFLIRLQDKWILSYDAVEQVSELYKDAIQDGINGARDHEIELLYSIAKVSKRKKRKEFIISNFELLPTSPIDISLDE